VSQINARGETVLEKPAFKENFERRRCLIPADGSYEWRRSGCKGNRGNSLRSSQSCSSVIEPELPRQALVTQVPKGHLGGPLEFRLR
jgi:hypothetical protein